MHFGKAVGFSQRNHACLASTIFSVGLERRGDIARFLLSFLTEVGFESSRMSMTALFHCNRDFGGNFRGDASNFNALYCLSITLLIGKMSLFHPFMRNITVLLLRPLWIITTSTVIFKVLSLYPVKMYAVKAATELLPLKF